MNFIIAVNDDKLLNQNFYHILPDNNFILQKGYDNIPEAYNDAILRCDQEYICLLHQDVYLPLFWIDKVKDQILNLHDKDWGVLGVAGVELRNNNTEKLYLGHIQDRGCEWGTAKGLPVKVDTLDELLLIIKNDGRLQFDKGVGNHFYGADICMQARLQDRKCYAINAYCHHNSIHGGELNTDFWESCNYMKKKYDGMLPIGTTCTVVQ